MSKEKRLIDANALAEHIKDLPTWWADDGDVYGVRYPDGMFECEDVISSIEDAPTVDAVEVVRCQECERLLRDLSAKEYHTCMRRRFPQRVNLDDFCSYGERKADE